MVYKEKEKIYQCKVVNSGWIGEFYHTVYKITCLSRFLFYGTLISSITNKMSLV